ncbi:hypothetical protein APV49_14250 (plasmid) [Staphylococcus aureus]|nr:hypothetical protein APV49_14250 [Staphylococcus aureus]
MGNLDFDHEGYRKLLPLKDFKHFIKLLFYFKITYCFIPIALLTLSLGTLNNPKTCRMVGLIAHAMPTFVSKFS